MIQINNLSKQYADQVLFTGLNFNVMQRERLGLVGRNGHGKTTLLKMIAGQESIDEGQVVVPKNYTLGFLEQFSRHQSPTVLEEGCLALKDPESDGRWLVEKILLGLGFSQEQLERSPQELSGGYAMRLNLGKVLIGEPDLLLLDEPTNYLDIVSIRWLVTYLKKWPGEMILVSHNREFMDSVVTHVMGIHRTKVVKIKGQTEKYYEKIELEEEVQEKNRVNLEKKKQLAQQYIDRFRAKAQRSRQVQSRMKAVAKMGHIEKLNRIRDLTFHFNEAPLPPNYCLDVRHVGFSYTNEPPYLFEDVSIKISKDDRIAIIGKNGRGKSTLMNVCAQQLKPLTGSVKQHPQAVVGHFAQTNTSQLNNSLSVFEEIHNSRMDGDKGKARQICGNMMFSGNAALKKIEVLSGGEKCRVLLGKLLCQSANLLLLDEPTHHLDMQSIQAMIDAVNDFNGAVMLITHDEHFLRSVANRLLVFQSDGVQLFDGGYDEFLQQQGWENEDRPQANLEQGPKLNKKEARRIRAQINDITMKLTHIHQDRLTSLEKEIDDKENHLTVLNSEMIKASEELNNEKIAKIAKDIGLIKKEIEALYEDMNVCFDNLDKARQQAVDETRHLQEQLDLS